jgi:hypothetical protein
MSRYRDPLCRIFTILADDFLGRFVVHMSEQKSYARRHKAPLRR